MIRSDRVAMKKIILFFILSFAVFNITSQEVQKDEPSWVYLKRAENLKDRGEYALAMIEANTAKRVYINERLGAYYTKLRDDVKNRNMTDYEVKKVVEEKRKSIMVDDEYPSYHELMGDLYLLTGFLEEADREYKKALSQKAFFDYDEKLIEIKYKQADVYKKKNDFDIASVVYSEIINKYLSLKKREFWDRVRLNIKEDPSLERCFRIYRIDGIQYMKALFEQGKRAALLQRPDDALFYLVNAAVVWMTYYDSLVKQYQDSFQYTNPIDFINYLSDKRINKNISTEDRAIIDDIMFFLGYASLLKDNEDIATYYFDIAITFSKNSGREAEITNRVEYFKIDKKYRIMYSELKD